MKYFKGRIILPALLVLLSIFITACDVTGTTFFKPAVPSVIRDLQDLINGINTFLSRISSVTGFFGFQTILLFISVLLISSGLSAIGLPRGKAVFITSLVMADAVWIIWKDSFNPGTLSYMVPVVRSNLILLAPLILYQLLKIFIPSLLDKIKTGLAGAIPGGRKKQQVQATKEASRELLMKSLSLYVALQKNSEHSASGEFPPAGASRLLNDIKSIIEKIEKSEMK